MSVAAETGAGPMIREWRKRRRLSQLDLALEAEISQRHLSFLESGRAAPSRAMVIRLAEHLSVPLRHRNRLLMAAGYAPAFGERTLDDPSLQPAMAAVEAVLRAQEPYPALAIDRHWNLLRANRALDPFLAAVGDAALLAPPVNVLRLSLHPRGLAPMIENLAQWRAHLLARLAALIDATADAGLEALEKELRAYPAGDRPRRAALAADAIATPLRLRHGDGVLSFISTTTVFGTPLDVTLQELAIESFFPADDATRAALHRAAP